MIAECGQNPNEQQGRFCPICDRHIPKSFEVWRENDDGESVACHENCHFQTCVGENDQN